MDSTGGLHGNYVGWTPRLLQDQEAVPHQQPLEGPDRDEENVAIAVPRRMAGAVAAFVASFDVPAR